MKQKEVVRPTRAIPTENSLDDLFFLASLCRSPFPRLVSEESPIRGVHVSLPESHTTIPPGRHWEEAVERTR